MRSFRSTAVLAMLLGALLLQGTESSSASASSSVGGSDTRFDDVSCASVLVCTAVGGQLDIPAVFRTTDGGRSWSPQGSQVGLPRITNVSCPTTSFCAAQGDSGAVQNYDYLNFATTKDGGASWTAPSVFVVNGTAGPGRRSTCALRHPR